MSETALSKPLPDGEHGDAVEARRLEALDRFDVLDTPKEEAFERIARLVRNVMGLPIGMVSLIDGHRQWVKASTGLQTSELERGNSLCNLTIRNGGPLVVSDTHADADLSQHPYVTGLPHVRCYVGIPLTTDDGHHIGTLCAIGHEPRQFSEREIDILSDLARVTMDEMQLRKLAVTDSLTGLLSRGAFHEEARRALSLALRHKHDLSLVVLDLDHFKAINDAHGHGVGDSVLRGVGDVLKGTQRQSDHLGRLGGEEFGVLLPHTNRAGAMESAERMRAAMGKVSVSAGNGVVGTTASLGVASLDAETRDIETLFVHADAALYEAKQAGRNRTVAWRGATPAAQSPRRRVLKAGRIVFNNRSSTIDCTVRSLGESGAGIDVGHTAGIPAKFRLVIRSDDFETDCRVVAQTDKHLEVEFI